MAHPIPTIGLVLLAAAALGGQQRSPEHARDLLRIDLAVVTREGQPVTDLKPEEITVRLGGRSRAVRSLQLVTVHSGEPSLPGLPPPFGSNVQEDAGRAVILALDEESLRPGTEGALRQAVDSLVQGLSGRDLLGLVTVPLGGVRVPLTTDHARVRNALGNLVGQSSGRETGSDAACRTGIALEALIGFIESLGYRDRPVTVLFLSGGLSAPRRDAPVTMAPGRCELRVELFRRVSEAAGAARAHFYVIQAVDIMARASLSTENIAGSGYSGSDNPIEGLEHLAGVTGGVMLPLAGAVERVLRESSAYYVAGVEPTDADRAGRPLPLEVRVSRPGVEVRSRPQIAFARPDWAAPRPANPSPREMIGVATVFADLPLRASAFSSLEPDGRTLRVTTLAEPIEAETKLASLVAALFNREGKLIANWVATEPELARLPVIGAMQVEPGAYRLRVAAIDASGRSGTADYDLEADLVQTGPLKLSSLVLGLSRDGLFQPRLEFSGEPVAIGYLELYGGAPGLAVSATLEIARALNGPALLTVPLAISPAGPGRYLAKGAIPLAALPAGDYAVRAIVAVEGQPGTRVTRTLRKRAGQR